VKEKRKGEERKEGRCVREKGRKGGGGKGEGGRVVQQSAV
jgi:hypothetical protein